MAVPERIRSPPALAMDRAKADFALARPSVRGMLQFAMTPAKPYRAPAAGPAASAAAPVLALVLAALLWSLAGVIIKYVQWSALGIAGVRSALAAPAILLLMRRRPVFTLSRDQIGAALCYASTVVTLVAATKLTTAANAILLQYTAPLYVAALAPWFLRESTRGRDWLFVGVVLGGMGLFFLDRLSPQGLWGNLLGVASGISYGGLALFMRRQRHASPFESIVLGNLLAAAGCLPFAGGPLPDAGGWAALVVLGLVQLAIPYFLYAWAIQRVSALEAVLIPAMEPVLNPLWVFLCMGERPGTFALAGGAVVLGAVSLRGALTARRQRRLPVIPSDEAAG